MSKEHCLKKTSYDCRCFILCSYYYQVLCRLYSGGNTNCKQEIHSKQILVKGVLFWYNFGISTGCCRAVFSGNKPSYQWHIFQKYEGLRRILRFQAVITFFGKYEDHLGLSTKSIRSFKYFLIAYTLIHCISYGWHMLLCPNKSEVDVLNSMTMDGLYLKNKIWRVLQHFKICQMFILGYNHFNIHRIWRYTCCQWEWEVVLCG